MQWVSTGITLSCLMEILAAGTRGTSVMFAIPLALVYIVRKLEASRMGRLSSTEANAATVTQNKL
jgi:hypothetical protein